MSVLFNFHSFLTVILLGICACTYFKMQFPAILEQRTGFRGFFWKAARIGERLSPFVLSTQRASVLCSTSVLYATRSADLQYDSL
ncbi:hypothetical protein P8452_27062 [Trifolium repens]|nr:hypothetical protein P8452_27062 [Trifolium repens]